HGPHSRTPSCPRKKLRSVAVRGADVWLPPGEGAFVCESQIEESADLDSEPRVRPRGGHNQDGVDTRGRNGCSHRWVYAQSRRHRSPTNRPADWSHAGRPALRAGPRHYAAPRRVSHAAIANRGGEVVRSPDGDFVQWRRL